MRQLKGWFISGQNLSMAAALAAGSLFSALLPTGSLAQQQLRAQPQGQPQPQAKPAANVEEILSYADLLFGKEQYSLAAQQYQTFIRENPQSPNLQIAWFRLGECYLKVNQIPDAETSFNFLVNTYKKGPFVGSAAYRLAVLRFNQKDYRNAMAFFKLAKDELKNDEAKLQAQFYYARSLQLVQQAKEALGQFEQVIAAAPKEKNPFYERSLLESARLFFELGDTEKALERFNDLARNATTKEFREEAIVRGGLLAAEAGKPELSEELLNKALKFSDTSPWKSLAQVGAIFNAFTREDYDRVIGLYNSGTYIAPDESRAKMLLIVGHSYRIKGDIESALRMYSLVEGKFPDQKEGIEAGYRKLQLLHQEGSDSLPDAVDMFVQRQRRIDPDSYFIDMAYLMKADSHFLKAENSASGAGSEFAKKHYREAAEAFKKVRDSNIDEKYHAIRIYKQGWSEIESDQTQDGIKTLSRFIQKYPDSDLASSALAKRAMAYQSQGDHQFALGDYQDIAKKFPKSPEVEFALQQVALIYAHQRKTPEMIAAYQELLEKFPETDGAAEAHYWIGVGHFDLEEYQKAIPELEKARQLDREHGDNATLRLVICHYQLEQIDQLAAEAKRYIESAPPAPTDDTAIAKRAEIPPQVLEYLGRKLSAKNDYEGTEFFLSAICDPEKPNQTSASVWNLLAESRLKLKKHQEAISAFDQYLLQTERPSDRAEAYLHRGIAQLCIRDLEAAKSSAQESLRSQKEGRTNAEARLLLGDVAAAAGNLEDAAREYLVVSQIFADPEVTPIALLKAAKAYQSLGNQEKARELEQQLRTQFPNFKEPKSLDYDC